MNKLMLNLVILRLCKRMPLFEGNAHNIFWSAGASCWKLAFKWFRRKSLCTVFVTAMKI